MGATNGRFGNSVVGFGIIPDTNNPDINIIAMGQGGIGLPEREYYFAAQFKPQRQAYRTYIQRTLARLGERNAAAAADRSTGSPPPPSERAQESSSGTSRSWRHTASSSTAASPRRCPPTASQASLR